MPESAKGLAGVQPFGSMVGKSVFLDHARFLNGGMWDVTQTGSGTAVLTAASATLPPRWTLTTDANASDTIAVDSMTCTTLDSATAAAWSPFVCKAGYDISLKARFMITSTVANCAVLIGLKKAGAALGSAAITVDDFVGFHKAAAAATMVGTVRTGDSSTETSTLETIVVNTWYDLEMKINGRGSVTFYVNGVKTSQTTMTNLPANTVNLALGCAIATNTTAAAVLVMETLVAEQEAI